MATEQQYSILEGDRLRVFAPNARCLSHEEIMTLPLEMRSAADVGVNGSWLEVACPKEACVTGRDEIRLSVKGVGERKGEGLWLRVFCPEHSCEITSPADLP